MKTFLKSNYLLIFILLFSFFWRFYDYSHRWVFNQDQARDAIIANYALQFHQIPLLGSPSSAGPFSFGPIYQWLIMTLVILIPFDIGPWVGFTLLSVLISLIFYFIGKNVKDKILGLFLASIAAFSSAQVANAPDMLNTVITAFFVSLAFLALTKSHYFLLGFFVAAAIQCHFQSLGLFALLLSTVIINRHNLKTRILIGLKIAIAFITSFIPLIVFDLKNNFVWSQSVIAYYTGGVNKFYIPIRWLTDIRDFWPQLWGNIITDIGWFGYILIPLFLISTLLAIKTKKISRFWLTLVFAFFIQILLVRYYKGFRSREYLIAFHPYFIFFTGWLLHTIYSSSKKFSLLLLLLLLSISSVSNFKIISQLSQTSKIYALYNQLNQKYPKTSFAVYSTPRYDMASLPIFYLLYRQNRINPTGTPITITIDPANNYLISDLPAPSTLELYTAKNIYNRLFVNYPSSLR